MNEAYYEVLAFRDIESRVEELFRAFLDVKLIEFASEGVTGYRDKVAKFRRDHLSPYNRATIDSSSAEGIELSPDKAAEVESAAQFLYWFDLRAQFWELNYRKAEELDEKLESGDRLAMLYADAKRLRDRLEKRGEPTPMAPAPPEYAIPKPERDPVRDKDRLLSYLDKIKAIKRSASPRRKKPPPAPTTPLPADPSAAPAPERGATTTPDT
jgi:hypothetical protein